MTLAHRIEGQGLG